MWYQATVTVAVTEEPITVAVARQHANADIDTEHDAVLDRLISAARGFVERYCGIRIGTQTVTVKCDSFADLDRLPEAPVQDVTISYVDADGATQVLSTNVYELRADGLDTGVVLKYGQAWPSRQPGSRLTLVLVAGYATVEPDLLHAMLMLIAFWFQNRETVNIGNITSQLPYGTEHLLTNFRRHA